MRGFGFALPTAQGITRLSYIVSIIDPRPHQLSRHITLRRFTPANIHFITNAPQARADETATWAIHASVPRQRDSRCYAGLHKLGGALSSRIDTVRREQSSESETTPEL